jgi:hypothetical protein
MVCLNLDKFWNEPPNEEFMRIQIIAEAAEGKGDCCVNCGSKKISVSEENECERNVL